MRKNKIHSKDELMIGSREDMLTFVGVLFELLSGSDIYGEEAKSILKENFEQDTLLAAGATVAELLSFYRDERIKAQPKMKLGLFFFNLPCFTEQHKEAAANKISDFMRYMLQLGVWSMGVTPKEFILFDSVADALIISDDRQSCSIDWDVMKSSLGNYNVKAMTLTPEGVWVK